MKNRFPTQRNSSGFTLIETLTVFALIAVLTAMLFPVFAQVREKARQSVCASNLRQIGVAVAMYRSDYDDYFPYATSNWTKMNLVYHDEEPWFPFLKEVPVLQDVLLPYVQSRSIFRCPSDTGTNTNPVVSPSRFEVLGLSYTFKESIGAEGLRESNMDDPSRTRYMYDDNWDWHSYKNASYWDLKGNVLCVDGHVKLRFWAKE